MRADTADEEIKELTRVNTKLNAELDQQVSELVKCKTGIRLRSTLDELAAVQKSLME